ncbi:MAG: tRNA (N(6)-L-threonylcarbamoyladenosine(37)-C(2))-methylthiotransferase MtaB [Lachnospiraceae bacterium]|nr:tRNA (N(6)-L-threonylcarbamoyladenosine(37)-C(2))-methylthiotransferase MtaB [Lachnospiraceae bacterium]
MKKAALHNLGCKVNAYETEAMQEILVHAGYEIVDFHEIADVYVINTCSVTNIADRKSRQMIHQAKKRNPNGIVVAAGCYVQTSEEKAKLDPAIDVILGNNQKNLLLSKIEAAFAARESNENTTVEAIFDINKERTVFEEMQLSSTAEHTRAFIKVQDGCNQFCTYCIIPYARGRIRSRKIDDVIRELTNLANRGFKEVVLNGIHLSSYGVDLEEDITLIDLIRKVHQIKGIERIRLGSLEPKIVTEEFAKELSKLYKICPHFHLSLQSGCDETLKRMNRKYTTMEYFRGCELLRKYFDNPAITTDVIVGFPGETEEEFAQTKAFLESVQFYEMHIFPYSRRKGTPADRMKDQVADQIKKERSHILLSLEKQMSKEYRDGYVGTTVEVLMEEPYEYEGKEYYVGYTKTYAKIAVPAKANYTNQIVSGTVTGYLQDDILLMEIR